jgi:outer membrane protein assembly factor BamB
MIRKCLLFAWAAMLFAPSLFSNPGESDGWPQFRGSLRNGSAAAGAQTPSWPEGGPALVWKMEIGSGFSEVVVSGQRLYTMFAEKTDSLSGWEYLASYDAATGKELWRSRVDSIFIDVDNWGDGPRSTPAVGQDLIFCFSGFGKLVALSKEDGSIRWTVDFIEQFGSTLPRWGYSTSPMLVGDLVMIEVGGKEEKAFAAFHKESGQLAWARATGEAMYTSPISATIDGQVHLIYPNGRNLYSFDEKGDTLWIHFMPIGNPMASPLFIPPNRVFVSANNGAGSLLLEVSGTETEEIFQSAAMKNDWSSSVYFDGHIYGFSLASLNCISVGDGQRQWGRRGLGKGSLILVGDKLIVLSDTGVLAMVEASPEGFRELGSLQAIQGRSWTAPSYANGRIYVRNHEEMACFELESNQ